MILIRLASIRCADPEGEHRFCTACAVRDQIVHHRDQCAHRPRAHLPQRRPHAGRADGIRMSADDVPGGRDRWRALLGRRICRQPDDHAAGARMRRPPTRSSCRSIRSSGRSTPRTAREIPQPAERDLLQLGADEGAAAGRASAPCRRPWHRRRCALGEMRMHRITTDMMTELGASSKLMPNGVCLHASRRGHGARRTNFSQRIPPIWACARRPISTFCWRSLMGMGLIGILFGLGTSYCWRFGDGAYCSSRPRQRCRRAVLTRAAARPLDANLHGRAPISSRSSSPSSCWAHCSAS